MGKYTKAAETIRKQQEFEKEQKELHRKYMEEPEHVVIKEKNNTIKFLIRTGSLLLKSLVSVLICCLAAIGILTLVYPDIREAFFSILRQIFIDVQNMNQS